nr:PilZ domain-containing protein [Gorillibacterium massiliense]
MKAKVGQNAFATQASGDAAAEAGRAQGEHSAALDTAVAPASPTSDTLPLGTTERRRSFRINLDIALQISVYQWEQTGSFSGQNIPALLHDLSEDGVQFVSAEPLTEEMFVVIHFPKDAGLPPITAKILRAAKLEDGQGYRYGGMMIGLAPAIRSQLEQFIQTKRNG